MSGVSKCRIDDNGRECTVCGEYKNWDKFHNMKDGAFGHKSKCKECVKTYMKEYSERNKDRIKEYREQNKDKIKEYQKEYHKEYQKEYWEQNKDKIKEYREKNKDKIKEYKKEYREKNKDKIKDRMKEYNKQSAKYSIYASQLEYAQCVEEGEDDILLVKCTYCGKEYAPTNLQVHNRLRALNGIIAGEHNLYCSNACKQACPTYRQREYRKDQKPDIAYETLDPYVRQEVFKRDNYLCQKCKRKNNKKDNPLHCHHINPKKLDPIVANDIDNLITLCKKCHIKTHQEIEGCGFIELAQCKEE